MLQDYASSRRERIRPLDAMAFMQKLTSNRFSQTQPAALTKFDHSPNGLATILPIEAAIAWKAG